MDLQLQNVGIFSWIVMGTKFFHFPVKCLLFSCVFSLGSIIVITAFADAKNISSATQVISQNIQEVSLVDRNLISQPGRQKSNECTLPGCPRYKFRHQQKNEVEKKTQHRGSGRFSNSKLS